MPQREHLRIDGEEVWPRDNAIAAIHAEQIASFHRKRTQLIVSAPVASQLVKDVFLLPRTEVRQQNTPALDLQSWLPMEDGVKRQKVFAQNPRYRQETAVFDFNDNADQVAKLGLQPIALALGFKTPRPNTRQPAATRPSSGCT